MQHLQLDPSQLSIRMDYHSHVAMEYARGSKWSEFLYFEPSGLRRDRMQTSTFEKTYYRSSEIPARSALVSFMRAQKRAYIPDRLSLELLLEAYYTLILDGRSDLGKCNTAELLDVYNELASALKVSRIAQPYKGSKAALLQQILSLHESFKDLTPDQQEAIKLNAQKAEARLAGLAELRALKGASKAATSTSTSKETIMATTKKSTSTAATKKAAPAAKKPAAKKPAAKPASAGGKKVTIGSLCVSLIKAGKDNDAILAEVKKQFKDAQTSASSIAWYRNKVKNGEM